MTINTTNGVTLYSESDSGYLSGIQALGSLDFATTGTQVFGSAYWGERGFGDPSLYPYVDLFRADFDVPTAAAGSHPSAFIADS